MTAPSQERRTTSSQDHTPPSTQATDMIGDLMRGPEGRTARLTVIAVLPQLIAEAASGALRIDTEPVPLAEIEATWQPPDSGQSPARRSPATDGPDCGRACVG